MNIQQQTMDKRDPGSFYDHKEDINYQLGYKILSTFVSLYGSVIMIIIIKLWFPEMVQDLSVQYFAYVCFAASRFRIFGVIYYKRFD